MKIKEQHLLIGISASFLLFAGGYFLGRNLVHPAVLTLRTAPIMETIPSMPDMVPEPAFPLNVNTASAAELSFLPGIGDTIAQRIVDWREQYGPFQELTDLLHVEGIGPTRLEEILPYIETGG